jgi:L-lactate dehydrogenase complex protein LldF
MNQTPQPHAVKSQAFVENSDKAHWHDEALWFIREKRDKQVHGIPEWERLRETASQIKGHTLSKLDTYLIAFEEKATALGAHVHWAKDGREHNQIVYDILRKHQVQRVVKSKSMLTEECHLNPFLEKHGIEVVDTDLGERIVQLRQETPSHIVLPAIHIKKEEVGALFHEHLGTEIGATDPKYLTEAARHHLRENSWMLMPGSPGSTSPLLKRGGSLFVRMKGMRTSVFLYLNCTSPVWAWKS